MPNFVTFDTANGTKVVVRQWAADPLGPDGDIPYGFDDFWNRVGLIEENMLDSEKCLVTTLDVDTGNRRDYVAPWRALEILDIEEFYEAEPGDYIDPRVPVPAIRHNEVRPVWIEANDPLALPDAPFGGMIPAIPGEQQRQANVAANLAQGDVVRVDVPWNERVAAFPPGKPNNYDRLFRSGVQVQVRRIAPDDPNSIELLNPVDDRSLGWFPKDALTKLQYDQTYEGVRRERDRLRLSERMAREELDVLRKQMNPMPEVAREELLAGDLPKQQANDVLAALEQADEAEVAQPAFDNPYKYPPAANKNIKYHKIMR